MLLLVAHHDADLGCWRLLSDILALAAITLYHLAYVFCKLGCTAVVNEYELVRARVVVLMSFVKEIIGRFVAIGCIALNSKSLKLLNDCQVYERVLRYN